MTQTEAIGKTMSRIPELSGKAQFPSFEKAIAALDTNREASDAEVAALRSTEFLGRMSSTLSRNKGTRPVGFRTDSLGVGTTRQLSDAVGLFRKCAPGVVLLVSPDGSSLGAGALLSHDGKIVTNWHVVAGNSEMAVWFYDSQVTSIDALQPQSCVMAKVTAVDETRDLALLKLSTANVLSPLQSGSDDQLAVAQDVFAIGHPKGYIWSFTYGAISQLRNKYTWSYGQATSFTADVVQTQTPVNPGNSGGPLFDEKGMLVGINSFRASGEGLNFAIRIGEVTRFVRDADAGKYPAVVGAKPAATSSKKPKVDEFDSDGDGKVDSRGIDTDADGYYELVGRDTNHDGTIDYIVGDANGDTRPDVMIFDTDENGTFETFLMDTNYDGKWDTVGVDKDGDMLPDEFAPYTP
jgi:S1-C subfamily serine protease